MTKTNHFNGIFVKDTQTLAYRACDESLYKIAEWVIVNPAQLHAIVYECSIYTHNLGYIIRAPYDEWTAANVFAEHKHTCKLTHT